MRLDYSRGLEWDQGITDLCRHLIKHTKSYYLSGIIALTSMTSNKNRKKSGRLLVEMKMIMVCYRMITSRVWMCWCTVHRTVTYYTVVHCTVRCDVVWWVVVVMSCSASALDTQNSSAQIDLTWQDRTGEGQGRSRRRAHHYQQILQLLHSSLLPSILPGLDLS